MDGRGIIPAYAGCTTCGVTSGRPIADHPRLRGVHGDDVTGAMDTLGSSPLTRGALTGTVSGAIPGRIIPAYAGCTPPTA